MRLLSLFPVLASLLTAPYFAHAQKDSADVQIDSAAISIVQSLDSIDWQFADFPFSKMIDSLKWMDVRTAGAEAMLNSKEDSLPDPAVFAFNDSLFDERMAILDAKSPFSLINNQDVKRFVQMYLKRDQMLSRMLGLAEFYYPLFEEMLDKYDMPLELKHLAIVESALNSRARSRAGAQGLWQFMYATGKIMGLEINSYVDERNDPYKSTEAACQYLQKMYDWFGEWDMALAAYNAGPGNVNKAIRRSGGKRTYWEIRPYLPRETQGYVPAFVAVNYVMNHAKDHGISPTPPLFHYFDIDTIHLKEAVSFELLEKTLQLNPEVIEALNPTYRKSFIPKFPGQNAVLALPYPYVGVFLNNEDSIYKLARGIMPAEEIKTIEPDGLELKVHRVSSGENLSMIAARYGVGVSQIKQWNGLRSDRINVGQRLQLYPKGKGADSQQGATLSKMPVREKAEENGDDVIYHRVQTGDTLYEIARQYPGISADQIMNWNNIADPTKIRTGDKIKIITGGS